MSLSTRIEQLQNAARTLRAAPPSDRQIKMIFACVFGLVLLILLVVAVASSFTGKEQPVVNASFEEDLPPPGFFADSQATTSFKAEDLFETITPAIDHAALKKKAAISQFERRRKQANSMVGAFVVDYDQEGGSSDYSVKNMAQTHNMDADFSAHKVPSILSTRPVDLSRTLPMTEIIPVILMDQIKSELPGKVVRALVPQDIYSYHGRRILVPSGSIAIGSYESLSKVGDSRLALNFYRIITPEGINIKLSGFAADSEGSEGLTGKLDNKNKEKFGSAAIASMIQAAAQLSVNVDDQTQKAAVDSISNPMNEIITSIISESINIAPTLEINKGTAFNIKFASDIWFPKPVNNIIETVPVG